MRSSVQHVSQAVGQSSADRNDVCRVLTVCSCDAAADGVSGDSDQLLDIARVKRQLEHPHVIDHLADARVPRFHERCIRLNFDCLGNLPDLQTHINRWIAADLKHNSSLCKRPKSRKRCF